jgi:lysophospholipase L1-like esterase
MRRKQFVLLAVIFYTAVLPAVSAQMESDAKVQYPDPARFEEEILDFEAADKINMPSEGAIVCTGSSSMRIWHTTIAGDLNPLTIIPRGFGGSNMNDLLYFTDRVVIKYKPRAVVIYQGDSDIDSGISPARVRDMFIEFTSKVHSRLPQTRIYFLSLKPSVVRWNMWPKKIAANALIADVCENDSRLTFLDVSTPMLDSSGNIRKDIFLKDDNHMNESGYKIWTGVVRPVLIKNEIKYE